MAQVTDEDGLIYGKPVAKSRTMPKMVGPFPLSAVVAGCSPVALSVVFRGAIWPFALLALTMPIAYLLSYKDVYIFDVLAAGASCLRPNRTRRIWGCTVYEAR